MLRFTDHLRVLEEVSLPEDTFDLVTFWFVVEHLPDPKRTLTAAVRVLRPNGWLVALVPLVDSWQAKLFRERWTEVREAPRHTGIPSVEGMQRLLRRCGLRLRKWESNSLLCNAGIFALSLVPSATVSIAYTTSAMEGLLWRAAGILMTFVGLPFAWAEKLAHHPRAGVFFAQKV